MIAARRAGGRGNVTLLAGRGESGFGGGDQVRGDQGGEGIFFAAEMGQQGGLFFRGEAIPDLDHLLGGADQDAGLGVGKFVGHGGGLGVQAVWKAHVSAFHTVWHCRWISLRCQSFDGQWLLSAQAVGHWLVAGLSAQFRAGLGRGD
jgi:hypothetical protein